MHVVISFLLIAFLSGCSSIPMYSPYAWTEQQKMQAAHHWDVLANDVASQVNKSLILNDYSDKAVYVKTTCGTNGMACEQGETTLFNEGFRDLLITRLVHLGVPTSSVKQMADIELNYKVQVVYHRTPRHTIQPGLLTTLAAGIAVLRFVPGEIQLIAAAGLLDFMIAVGPPSGHYEIIISTSMVTNEKYLFRTSDIYYINDPDFWHYQNQPPNKVIRLVSTTQWHPGLRILNHEL